MCLPAFTPQPKTTWISPPSFSAGVNTSFNGVMDQIINNQLDLSPRRCCSPRSDRSVFPSVHLGGVARMFPWLSPAAAGLLKRHSNRPVCSAKIGLASVKQTQRHRCNTHFTSLIMRPSPSEPSFTSRVFPSSPGSPCSWCPFSSWHSDLEWFNCFCINISAPLEAVELLFVYFYCFPWNMKSSHHTGTRIMLKDKQQFWKKTDFIWGGFAL